MIGSICSSLSSGAARLYERVNVKKAAAGVGAAALAAGVYVGAPVILSCINPESVCTEGSFFFPGECHVPTTSCTPALNSLKENGGVIAMAFVTLLLSLQYLNNRTLKQRIQTLEARAGLNPPAGDIPPPPPIPAAPLVSPALVPTAPVVLPTPAAPPKKTAAAAPPKFASARSSSAASALPITHEQALAAAIAARQQKPQNNPIKPAPKTGNNSDNPLAVPLQKAREALEGKTLPTISDYHTRPRIWFTPPPAPAQSPKSPTSSSRSSPGPSNFEPLPEKKTAPSPEPVAQPAKTAMAFWKARDKKT